LRAQKAKLIMPGRDLQQPSDHNEQRSWRLPDACGPLVQQLFGEAPSARWNLSFQSFYAALNRGAGKRFGATPPSLERVQEYFATLHVRDLALSCACSDGSEVAWEDFVAEYRGYLRAAAAALLRRSPGDPSVVELADSLITDLYGIADGKLGGRSLFRYFHGRSSLKTWLRAVLAQRHIDIVRAAKKFDSLDDAGEDGSSRPIEPSANAGPADPHREMYLQRFRSAFSAALQSMDARDRLRLQRYYADERTLAEIGKELGEHESSVSRNLERIRKELRAVVEGLLRAGNAAANGGQATSGMDDAQIGLCLQYSAEDAAFDLDRLFTLPKPEKLGREDAPQPRRSEP
jgi:RNA polymerase sigma factor (sigma-70 family)